MTHKDGTGEAEGRSQTTKDAFITYLTEHPEERFWQSVRNFAGVGFVYVSKEAWDGDDIEDTFYKEEL